MALSWQKECSEVVGAMADAGKRLIGVESVEMGGRVIKGPYARWAELVAEAAALYAIHGQEARGWLRDLLNQPDFEVLFDIIRREGGVDAQLFEAYIIHKYPLVPRYSTLTWFELGML
jgi:hypothetical protein